MPHVEPLQQWLLVTGGATTKDVITQAVSILCLYSLMSEKLRLSLLDPGIDVPDAENLHLGLQQASS